MARALRLGRRGRRFKSSLPDTAMKKIKTYYLDANCSYLSSYLRKQGSRVIETSRSRKFWHRDEREYLSDINKENAIFITQDTEFIQDLVTDRTAHSGVIYVDNKMDLQKRIDYVANAVVLVQAFTENAESNIKNKIIFSDENGIYITDGYTNYIFVSWSKLEE